MIQSLNWKAYIAELLVVVLGISIAFQVEEFSESRRLDQIHQTLVSGLRNEIDLNIRELEDTIATHEAAMASSVEMNRLLENENPDVEAIAAQISQLLSLTTPDLQTAQLETYVRTTVELSLATRPLLLELLTTLEEIDAQSALYSETKFERPWGYLNKSYDFSKLEILDIDAILSTEFRNTLLLARYSGSDMLRVERKCLTLLQESLTLL